MAKKKPKRSYTTTTLDSSGYIEGGGVRSPTSQPLGRHQVQQSALCLFNFYFSFFCDLQFFATGWAANGV